MPTNTLEWRESETGLSPVLNRGKVSQEVVWAPQPGSQVAFASCPVYECLYEGTRGPGKTVSLLMSWLQHVGRGWGAEWRGVLPEWVCYGEFAQAQGAGAEGFEYWGKLEYW